MIDYAVEFTCREVKRFVEINKIYTLVQIVRGIYTKK